MIKPHSKASHRFYSGKWLFDPEVWVWETYMVRVTWFELLDGPGLNGAHPPVLHGSRAPFVQASLSASELGLDSKAFFFDASYCWLS